MASGFRPTFNIRPEEPAGFPRPAELPPLVTLGDARLGRPSEAVDPAVVTSKVFQARLKTLHWCLIAERGLGIAAPQVGMFERFFVLAMREPTRSDETPAEVSYWINPVIEEASAEQAWCWEGCLSVPGLRGWVRRPAAVLVSGLNERGETVRREFTGWLARAWQHEYDHLDGMLFPHRVADPRHLVSDEALAARADWPAGWPAPGARDQPLGVPLPERDPP